MVANTNSRKCIGWHLHKNAAENSKRHGAITRTAWPPPTDHYHCETTESLLAGHVISHDDVVNKVLLWKPNGPRRRGQPTTTLQNIIEKDTNLSGTNLLTAVKN